jgi:outer membrane protein TolC
MVQLVSMAQDPDPSPPPVQAAPSAPSRELRLSLPDALKMALENNLQVSIERERPREATARVGQALGAFDPLGFSEYSFTHDEQPIASSVQNVFAGLELVTQIENDEWTYNGGLTGILPFGLRYSSIYNFQRLDTTSSFNNLEPQNTPTWRSELTFPLLRDLINNEANVTVKRSRIAESISEEEFQRSLTDELLAVEEAYWELAAARAEQRVAGKSLQTAEDLLEQTRVQYEVGVVSKVAVTEALAGVAEREVTVILAANRRGNAQDDLLNRIDVPAPEEFAETAVVTEEPSYVEYDVDDRVALGKAMELRPELAAARRRVEDAELLLRFAENQRLLRLDLNASYTFTGLSGTRKTKAADPNTGAPIKPFDNGWTSAHNDFFDASGSRGWGIGARVEIPLGNRTARHQVTERVIGLRRLPALLDRGARGQRAAPRRGDREPARRAGAAAPGRLDALQRAAARRGRLRGRVGRGRGPARVPEQRREAREGPGDAAPDAGHLGGERARAVRPRAAPVARGGAICTYDARGPESAPGRRISVIMLTERGGSDAATSVEGGRP